MEAGKYYVAVVSWAHQAKNRAVARNVQRLQGPGTAGMIVWRSQARLTIGRRRRRRRAAGLNARSPCVDGMRWRVNGLSCAWRKSDSRTLGQRRDYLRATRRLPAWVTAGKGPIAPGRSRGQNQQVQVPDDRADRPRRQDVTVEEKCLKPRSRPGDHSSIASSSEDPLTFPIAQEHVATLLCNVGCWLCTHVGQHAQSSMCGMAESSSLTAL